ncbi:hypothetical protein KKH36_03525, partial [Patescibacteria group bacterium]|nr:hypothetical protein [Patescibacteria group bacterium]
MPKLNYKLNVYIKALNILLKEKGFDRVKIYNKSGSAVHFDLFNNKEEYPCCMWQVHTEHKSTHIIKSKEDYKKAARNCNATLEEFIKIL